MTLHVMEDCPEAALMLASEFRCALTVLHNLPTTQLHVAFIRVCLRQYLQPDRHTVISLPGTASLPVPVRRGLQRLGLGLGACSAAPRGCKRPLFSPADDTTDLKRAFADQIRTFTGKARLKLVVCLPKPNTDAQDPWDRLAGKYGLVQGARWPAVGLGLGTYRVGCTLLVGDRPGPGWARATLPSWPFVSALKTGCSGWLAEQLETAGIPEDRLYWINAYRYDGTPIKTTLLKDLQPARVVALGNNAATWCRANEEVLGTFAEVHHPSYWKRFHSHQAYHLIKLLRK